MSFPITDATRRTNEFFRLKQHMLRHSTRTYLENLTTLDMVGDFPTSDPLHLLHLGIVLRWTSGTGSYKKLFEDSLLKNVNQLLKKANTEMPSEINRAVWELDEVRR